MSRTTSDTAISQLVGPGLRKALDTIATALNAEIQGDSKPVIITPDTLHLLFQQYRANISPTSTPDDLHLVSRFTDALTCFARSVRSLQLFQQSRPNSQQIAEMFRMFCKLGTIPTNYQFSKGSSNAVTDNSELSVIDITPSEARRIFGGTLEERQEQMKQLKEVVDAYLAVARSRLGSRESARYADELEVVLNGVNYKDAVHMAYLLKLELNEQMCSHIQSFMDKYDHWFCVDFAKDIQKFTRELESAVALGDNRRFSSATLKLQNALEVSRNTIHLLRNLSRYLKVGPLTEPFYGSIACADVVKRHWDPVMQCLSGFIHDYNNIIQVPITYVCLLMIADCESAKDVQDSIDFLKTIDYSTLGSMLDFVGGMLRDKAEKADAKIFVNVGEKIISLHIPERVRSSLFRVIFELGLNAVKYADDKKEDKRIFINASMREKFLRILISDNGIGIENLEGATESGLREHPDLAEGKGLGLASVVAIIDDKKWDFELDSRVGFGTTARIEINTSSWRDGPKKVGGGGWGGGQGNVLSTDWPASVINCSIYPDFALYAQTPAIHSPAMHVFSGAHFAFNVIPVLAGI